MCQESSAAHCRAGQTGIGVSELSMRVTVTGGAGFIGSHLVELLLSQGHQVTVLDNFSTGKRANLPSEAGQLTIIHGDVADPQAVEEALTGRDGLVHLAAVASVEASVRDPLGTHRTNLEGSILLFQTAADLGVKRVVYASSAAVYGNNAALPLTEEHQQLPLSPYAADKLAGEHYLAFYHRLRRFNATAFRFFNVFGPRQDPASPYSGVISIFLDRASRGLPLKVFGDGKQSRDFVYVTDVVAALASELERLRTAEAEMQVYNVGRGIQVSLLDLLDNVSAISGGKDLEVAFEPRREGDIVHSLSDVSKLRSTGWAPQTSILTGLERTFSSLSSDPQA